MGGRGEGCLEGRKCLSGFFFCWILLYASCHVFIMHFKEMCPLLTSGVNYLHSEWTHLCLLLFPCCNLYVVVLSLHLVHLSPMSFRTCSHFLFLPTRASLAVGSQPHARPLGHFHLPHFIFKGVATISADVKQRDINCVKAHSSTGTGKRRVFVPWE